MEANNKQVGGDHYKSEYQHWDMAAELDMKYFEGNATKYLARYKKKNGIQDLEKAKHYVQKLLENVSIKSTTPAKEADMLIVLKFLETNQILGKCRQAILKIATWADRQELEEAVCLIDDLIVAEMEDDMVKSEEIVIVEDPKFKEDGDEWRK